MRMLSPALLLLSVALPSAEADRLAWWREAKVGLFIAWGPYAVPGGTYGDRKDLGEGILTATRMPVAEYRAIAQRFLPISYDPGAWARIAKDAGLRYVVMTAKHQDGFALFPSAASTWDIVDATPGGRDLLEPLATAVRGEGLRWGLYYSQAQDAMHPGGAKAGFPEGKGWDEAQAGSFDDYLTQVARPQVQELLTRYQPDLLWWDTPFAMTAARAAPLAAVAASRPAMLTNNRLGGNQKGDYTAFDQLVPVTGCPLGAWETRVSLGKSWSFNASERAWKSSADLVRRVAEVASQGGNLLLGVGPDAAGQIPPAAAERLEDLGRWLRVNGEAIYGTVAGPFPRLPWGCATRKGDRLYLHVLAWPKDRALTIPLISGTKGAWLLAQPNQPLEVTRQGDATRIVLPATPIDATDTVVVLQLEGEPKARPLASAGATAEASVSEANFPAAQVLDRSLSRRWMAPAGTTEATLTLTLATADTIGAVAIDEPDVWPRLRQHLRVEAETAAGTWITVGKDVTTGLGQVIALKPTLTKRLRLTLASDKGRLGLAEVIALRAE